MPDVVEYQSDFLFYITLKANGTTGGSVEAWDYEDEIGADSLDELLGAGYGARLVQKLALPLLKQKNLEAYIAAHAPSPDEQPPPPQARARGRPPNCRRA